jgi:hypothetical protein
LKPKFLAKQLNFMKIRQVTFLFLLFFGLSCVNSQEEANVEAGLTKDSLVDDTSLVEDSNSLTEKVDHQEVLDIAQGRKSQKDNLSNEANENETSLSSGRYDYELKKSIDAIIEATLISGSAEERDVQYSKEKKRLENNVLFRKMSNSEEKYFINKFKTDANNYVDALPENWTFPKKKSSGYKTGTGGACQACNGHGKVAHYLCQGKGGTTCTLCSGKGILSWNGKSCHSCGGSGNNYCESCLGTGLEECNICSGKGR